MEYPLREKETLSAATATAAKKPSAYSLLSYLARPCSMGSNALAICAGVAVSKSSPPEGQKTILSQSLEGCYGGRRSYNVNRRSRMRVNRRMSMIHNMCTGTADDRGIYMQRDDMILTCMMTLVDQ